MQLYALNQEGLSIYAKEALKKIDYTCLECGAIVRLRAGGVRQPHFYHLIDQPHCRQYGKGEAHLQVQVFIQTALKNERIKLEVPFPKIKRIADAVWEKQKIVFEVQCSSMSRKEMLSRVADYQREGYQVVWILHEKRYNQWKRSALEEGVQGFPHYYTNIDYKGRGQIYDQWAWIEKGIQKEVLAPLPIDLAKLYPLKKRSNWAKRDWPFGFEGDLLSLRIDHPYVEKALALQMKFKPTSPTFLSRAASFFKAFAKTVLRKALEPYCDP